MAYHNNCIFVLFVLKNFKFCATFVMDGGLGMHIYSINEFNKAENRLFTIRLLRSEIIVTVNENDDFEYLQVPFWRGKDSEKNEENVEAINKKEAYYLEMELIIAKYFFIKNKDKILSTGNIRKIIAKDFERNFNLTDELVVTKIADLDKLTNKEKANSNKYLGNTSMQFYNLYHSAKDTIFTDNDRHLRFYYEYRSDYNPFDGFIDVTVNGKGVIHAIGYANSKNIVVHELDSIEYFINKNIDLLMQNDKDIDTILSEVAYLDFNFIPNNIFKKKMRLL